MQGLTGLFTVLLLSGYVLSCELRAPTPWVSCEPQWKVVWGVLCPSPIAPIGAALMRRRRRQEGAANLSPPSGDR